MAVAPETIDREKKRSWMKVQDPILIGVGFITGLALFFILVEVSVLTLGAFRSSMLFEPGIFTLQNFREILASPDFVTVARNTAALGLGTTIIMLGWAVPFVWLYTRTDLPGKNLFIVLLTIQIAVPSFLIALGYIFFVNPTSGILNRWLMAGFGLSQPPLNIYGLGWIIFLQGTALATPAFFMMAPAFQALDSALEESAYTSGIRKGRVFFRITLPLLWPTLLTAFLYYMIIAMEIFDYAGMLGLPVGVHVLATWIFELVNPPSGLPRYNEAAAIGFLFSVFGGMLMLLYFWMLRRSERFAVVTGKRGPRRATKLGRTGIYVAWTAIIAYAVLEFVLPVFMLVWASLLPYLQPPSLAAFKSMTLEGYRQAIRELPQLLKNTIQVAVAVPTISVIVAACLSWVMVRTKMRSRRLIELMVVCSIGVPSIVGALAFMYFGLSIFRLVPIYTTVWIIVMAMATRYLVWGTRTINSSMMQIHRELEEACFISGVRRGRAFLSVILPVVKPALIFSWFWIALLSLRELTIPIMLSRNETQTMSTAIWGFNASGVPYVAAALGVILLLIVFTMVLLFQKFVGKGEFG